MWRWIWFLFCSCSWRSVTQTHTQTHSSIKKGKTYLYWLKIIRNNKLFRDLFNQDDIIKKKSLDKASQLYQKPRTNMSICNEPMYIIRLLLFETLLNFNVMWHLNTMIIELQWNFRMMCTSSTKIMRSDTFCVCVLTLCWTRNERKKTAAHTNVQSYRLLVTQSNLVLWWWRQHNHSTEWQKCISH